MKRLLCIFLAIVVLGTPTQAANVIRYFSTSGAGAADGTTWANRAALFSAGNWSTVVTGFDWTSDSLVMFVEGGLTYTCSQSLTTSITTVNDPTAVNSIYMVGCDSSGNMLAVPDPNWLSCDPAFTDTALPTINTTSNIAIISIQSFKARLIKFTATSGRNGVVVALADKLDWCVVSNATANASAGAASGVTTATNCVMTCTGSSYAQVLGAGNSQAFDNLRIVGVTGSSGNRDGLNYSGTTARTTFERLTIINNGGRGWAYTGTSTGVNVVINSCVIANNAGDQILFPNTAAQTSANYVDHCIITGGSAIGINPGGANTNLYVTNTRLRDNVTANLGTFGNYPTDHGNYTTDSDDATEYVSSTDFRIKAGSTIHGMGFGVSEQASGGSAFIAPHGNLGGFNP